MKTLEELKTEVEECKAEEAARHKLEIERQVLRLSLDTDSIANSSSHES